MNPITRLAVAALAVAGLAGCAEARQLLAEATAAEAPAEAAETAATADPLAGPITPTHHGPQVIDGGRYVYPLEQTGEACMSLYGVGVSMPCRLVLNVCLPDGSTLLMPAQFACTPAMPSLAEACAEQPQYAAWYGCPPREEGQAP